MSTKVDYGFNPFAASLRKIGFISRRVDTAALIARLAHLARVRRDMRRLSDLDDHMLRDIGVSRSGIEPAVRFGRR
jgi:uncharacterized protein YjiS (DUF1127 family)